MGTFVGTGSLVRLALRRDRIMLPVWIVLFVLTASSSASATVGLYPTISSRVEAAGTFNSTPALVALYGRIYDPTSLGALAMLKLSALGAALVAVLGYIVVVRHTRAEEESGRLELLGATVVGRRAPLTAALIVAAGTNLVLGLLTALGQIGAGLPATGAVAFGLAWAGAGLAFAAVGAVAAQLTSSARAANALSSAVLGLAYLLRAVGDSAGPNGPTWVSWLSPIGWAQQLRPFAGDRFWVLLLLAGFAVLAIGGAYALVARRDIDAGLLPDRPGPASASALLRSPFALAWRLHRTALFGWLAGFVVLGAVLGSIATNVGSMLSSPQAREMIVRLGGEKGLTDSFLAAELGITGLIASVYAVQAAMRLRAEETAQRVEPLLATATGRIRWAAGHIVMSLLGTGVLVAATGVAAGLSYGAAVDDLGQVGRVLGAALAYLPAIWVVTAVVVAAFGLAPRAIMAGWAALVAFLVLELLGPLLKLDQWVMDVSPFTHVPKLPGTAFSATPLVWLAVVAAVFTSAGLAAFRRRDIG
ncbi:ABC transporter permease [Solihabitans fulvus]|uniref:ABC transporter permease n=1 Tax=Solihabitans fulvus TaxID=1892852 RepID=A0A5B2X6K6_9PSEU|nr:ABC transporter permease [Solihabitans fulvus]KAA2258835.1 ABC transporter permease [Solihabitans fulvus]